MRKIIDRPDISVSPEAYLADIRNRVTRHFIMFYFALSLLAVPAAYMARNSCTLVINIAALIAYTVPFLLVQFTARYRLAAKIFVSTSMVVIVINALLTNRDISPATIVWYFVYLVFSHLVLNLAWAIVVAVAGAGSVAVFSIYHIRELALFSENYYIEHSVLIGSPIALTAAMIALLYLLSVYKNIRDVMIGNVLAASQEANRFLGVLSHDMRNYLGAVSSIQELIAEEYPAEEYSELAKNMHLVADAASRGMALVDEVVTASRDLTEQQLFLEKTDISDFLQPLVDRYRIIARAKGISVRLAEHIDKIAVMVNRDKFSRVIENLLSNAVKFCREEDTITIGIECEKNWVTMVVEDTGIGIPDELQSRIFEPFSGSGRIGTAREKSVGLGMSIVKKLVDLHNGRIWIESQVDKGTSVFIRVTSA